MSVLFDATIDDDDVLVFAFLITYVERELQKISITCIQYGCFNIWIKDLRTNRPIIKQMIKDLRTYVPTIKKKIEIT